MTERSISFDSVVARGDGHVESELHDETVLMSLDRGKYYAMAETAQAIWLHMAEPVSVGTIVDRLTAEYDVERGTCERAVLGFVGELLAEGLAKRVEQRT